MLNDGGYVYPSTVGKRDGKFEGSEVDGLLVGSETVGDEVVVVPNRTVVEKGGNDGKIIGAKLG